MSPLRVLITNLSLCARSGTELYARDLALALARLGHVPAVYSPLLGVVAEELRAAQIAVVADLAELPWEPDVVHGHHHPETITALTYFPHVPAVFVCHDRTAWHDQPPQFQRIRHYVAVDENCRQRFFQETSIAPARVSVIGNGVDLRRFRRRGPLPAQPRRALCFSNYAGEEQVGPIRRACSAAGMSLDVMGSASRRQCPHPEAELGRYDVVFARGRCALEAAATGCAVVIVTGVAAGPMARAEDWRRLRAWNFGWGLCTMPLSPRWLLAQIRRYDPADAAEVCRLARATAGLDDVVAALLRLYGRAIEEHRADPPDPVSESRATAKYLREQRPYSLLHRLADLDRERESWRRSAEQAHEGWARLQTEYEQLRRAAEQAHEGWKRANDTAEMLTEVLRQAEARSSAAQAPPPRRGWLAWLRAG